MSNHRRIKNGLKSCARPSSGLPIYHYVQSSPRKWGIRAFIALLAGLIWAQSVVREEKRGIILRQFNACLPPVINFLRSSEEILVLPPPTTRHCLRGGLRGECWTVLLAAATGWTDSSGDPVAPPVSSKLQQSVADRLSAKQLGKWRVISGFNRVLTGSNCQSYY